MQYWLVKSKIHKSAKIILVNLIIIFIFYILIEILSGDLIFKKKKCSYILCNANYNYTTDLYTEKKINIKYTKDENGFRGRTKNLDQIDILVIGGSTTDERYLNISDTWSEKLEELFFNESLNIDVVNAGIDGQSTFGHIWNFKNWFTKIRELKAKYVIFYIGINEKQIAGRHDLNVSEVRYPKKILYLLKYNNGLTSKIFEFLIKKKLTDKANVAHSKSRAPIYIKPYYKIDYKFEALPENIESLINLTRNFGAEPIFVTQKTLRWKIENEKIYSISKNENYYLKEKKISKIILNKCRQFKIVCVDGFNKLRLDRNDTYDLVHTSPSGSTKIANFIFNNIKNRINFF